MPFAQIAAEAVTRGFRVIILNTPADKEPKAPNTHLCPNGAKDATDNPLTIAEWNSKSPDANVGTVAGPGCAHLNNELIGILDDDEGFLPSDLFANLPAVKSPHGMHRPFLQDDEVKGWDNFSHKTPPDELGKRQEIFSCRLFNQYVVGPGSLVDGLTYTVTNNVKPVRLSEAQKEFLRPFSKKMRNTLGEKRTVTTERKLDSSFSMEKMLAHYEMKFTKDGGLYHVHADKGCPVAGRVHFVDDSKEPRKIEQCTFFWEPGLPPTFKCLSGGCEGKDFKDAHSAIIRRNPTKKVFKVWEKPEERALIFNLAADRVPKKREYMWDPFFLMSAMVHGMGTSGEGKSPVTVDMAARITAGLPWPDGTPNTMGPRSVIMMNLEDDFDSVIYPRFHLAGGDPKKLYFVEGTRLSTDAKSYDTSMALDRDFDLLRKLAEGIPDLGMIVTDPITNYLGHRRMNAEEEVRSVLTPLATLAQQLEIVVWNIGHLNKRERGTNVLHRGMGAAAFIGVSRETYLFGPDPDSDDTLHDIRREHATHWRIERWYGTWSAGCAGRRCEALRHARTEYCIHPRELPCCWHVGCRGGQVSVTWRMSWIVLRASP